MSKLFTRTMRIAHITTTMMPSRGLRLVRGNAPSLIRQQCRHLSYTPQPLVRNTSPRTGSSTRTAQPWTRSIPTAMSSLAAIRHASTTTTTITQTPADPSTAPIPESSLSSLPDLDTITLDNMPKTAEGLDISSIPEGIGYLKQIGLDFGYGPTSMIEWVLEHLHIWGGLPWWGAIAATAVAVRAVMLPLYLKSSDMMARQNALTPMMKPITDRMAKSQKEGNTAEVMTAYKELALIRKRAGISVTQQILPSVLQGVIGICSFKILRAASELPVPGFQTGGFLWLQDLTMTDGYLLMPIIMAGSFHIMARMGGGSGAPSELTAGMKKFMLWGMPAVICLITAWQSGAVCVWFAASSATGIIQGKMLQQRAVRNFFDLAPMYVPKPGERGGFLSAMLEERTKGLQPQKFEPSASAGAKGGRNAAYMAPSYQSPNINKKPRTIDTTLVAPNPAATSAPSAEMIQPGQPATPKNGLMDQLQDKLENLKQHIAKSPEKRKQEERAAFKRRAQQYEEKAQKRGGR